MSAYAAVGACAVFLALILGAYLFWRYVWFFRNPRRKIPAGESILSPADGTVVYVKRLVEGEPAVSLKNGRSMEVGEIVREHVEQPKMLVGIFMSPFNVHYNRTPLSGRVESVVHSEPRTANSHMGSMHWRCLLQRFPLYENSPHLLSNERTVIKLRTVFRGSEMFLYLVQIAGGSVRGIDSFVQVGQEVRRGEVFGLIRVGSQVDLVCTRHANLRVRVRPGDKVKAGETVLME